MCFSIFRGLTDRPVQARYELKCSSKEPALVTKMNHRIYLFPFRIFMWERCVSAQQTRAGRHPKSTACTHTRMDTAVNSMHLCKLVHTNDHMSLFKRSDAQAWIHRERVRSVVSLALVWSLSLSLSLCPFFFSCLGAAACPSCVGATHPPICAHQGPQAQSPSGIFLCVCRVVTYDGHHRQP